MSRKVQTIGRRARSSDQKTSSFRISDFRPSVNRTLNYTYGVVADYYVNVSCLIVAGGGAGGFNRGGGGGGGGVYYVNTSISTATIYSITIGAGGAGIGSAAYGSNGTNSSIIATGSLSLLPYPLTLDTTTSLIAAGGGAGGYLGVVGLAGGSGGGAGAGTNIAGGAALGTQGFKGGNSVSGTYGSGGGGAFAAGSNSPWGAGAGVGANGVFNDITGGYLSYGAGGTGGNDSNPSLGGTDKSYFGGFNGGGKGGNGVAGGAGLDNTGGGGGGGGGLNGTFAGGNGGSGIVIITYPGPYQLFTGGGVVQKNNGDIIHIFKSSDNLTPIIYSRDLISQQKINFSFIKDYVDSYVLSNYSKVMEFPAQSTITSNVTALVVGAGGGTQVNATTSGGGGGGVYYNTINVVSNAVYNITVGLGFAGENGGNSEIVVASNNYVLVRGIGGGKGGNTFNGQGGSGGSGGGSFGATVSLALGLQPTSEWGGYGSNGGIITAGGQNRPAGGGASSVNFSNGVAFDISGQTTYYGAGSIGGRTYGQSGGGFLPGRDGAGMTGTDNTGGNGTAVDPTPRPYSGGASGADSGASGKASNFYAGATGIVIISHPATYKYANVTGNSVYVGVTSLSNIEYKTYTFLSNGTITFN